MAVSWPSFVPTYHHATYDAISETLPSHSCEGKAIFITGGGSGIGRAIAKSFATANADGIFLIGRHKAALQETVAEIKAHIGSTGRTRLEYMPADILDAPALSAAFDKAIATFGRIDVLVQNAGYLDSHRSITDSDPADYWRAFEVNVKGGLNVIQAFLKRQPKTHSTIINVSSGAGHIAYIPGYSAYSSSKLAFAKIIEYVHHENPELRVFNINPGAIATAMQKKAGDIPATDDVGKYCATQFNPNPHM